MELLHSCMKETLRMYPPLIMLMRMALKDVQYKDYIIPKGDIVATCPPVANRLESVYTNPNKFDPVETHTNAQERM
jgi:sterol 14-demethylase